MKDERVISEINKAKSFAYRIIWFGLFGILLYRWFALDQTLLETLDIFLVWFTASMFEFFIMAVKGLPLTYPVNLNKNERVIFLFGFPIIPGIIAILILLITKNIESFKSGLFVFLRTYLIVFAMYLIYIIILYFWEKKNID
jgi:voltage-gated potassium channel Kch